MKYTSCQLIEVPGGYKGRLNYKDGDKWRAKVKRLAATGKREAKAELEKWRAEMETEAEAEAEQPGVSRPGNVGEFVEQYIDTLELSQAVERSTLTPYRALLKHIKAGIGDMEFNQLDPDTAQAWVNGMAADGYAPSTVRKALNLLKAAYADGVERRVLPYNPVAPVRAPKLKKREPNALDPEQRGRLLAYLEVAGNTPTNIAIRMALLTGMREGELCGLRWRDVDLKGGALHIRNVIGRDGGKTYEKEPKTGGSRRDVPLSPELARMLRDRRGDMAEQCMEAGVPLTPGHYVLGTIDGRYMAPHSLWREWKAIAKSLGLVGTEGRTPTFHDLRHTFATAAIASGADVKSVSSILGHANAAMTLNVYASADAEAKRRTMDEVSRVMEQAPKPADILRLDRTGTDD